MRLVGALGVVLSTYNPTGYSFYHWALRDLANITALKAFAGALLLAGWVICIRAAFISLGRIGIVLSALVLGTLVLGAHGLRRSRSRSSVLTLLDLTDSAWHHSGHRSVLVAAACARDRPSRGRLKCLYRQRSDELIKTMP